MFTTAYIMSSGTEESISLILSIHEQVNIQCGRMWYYNCLYNLFNTAKYFITTHHMTAIITSSQWVDRTHPQCGDATTHGTIWH